MRDVLSAIRAKDVPAVAAAMASVNSNTCVEAMKLASVLGDEAVFEAVFEVGVKKADWGVRAALRPAVRARRVAIVEKLIALGARDREWRGCCAADAALLGDLPLMRLLDVAAKAVWSPKRIEQFDEWPNEEVIAHQDGSWPLFNAIRTGDIEVVRFVVDKGVDVNFTTNAGRNPVELARALGHEDIAALLAEAGGVEFDRSTVSFSQAVFYGLYDEFLERVDAEDETQRGYAFGTAVAMGHMRLVHALAPYATPKQLATGVGSAAARGDLHTLHALISLGAKVNCKDRLGRTPLIWAAANGRVAALQMLVKAGAKLDAKGGDRQTALETAIFEGRVEAARYLIEAGANPNTVAGDGSTPLSRAMASPHAAVFLPLLEAAGARSEYRAERLKGLKKKLSKAKRRAYRFEPSHTDGGVLGTRIGGQPYLTRDYPRPTGATGPLTLLMQVDLRAHPDKKQRRDALLQLFDAPGAHPPVVARLVPAPEEGAHTPDGGPERTSIALGFSRAKTDFPSRSEDVVAELSHDEAALLPFLNLMGDKLGGWPDWVQDAESRPGERLVLQLVGGGVTQRDFGDAGNLYVFAGPDGVRVLTQSY